MVYGVAIKAVCLQVLTNRSLVREADPMIMFDEVRTLYNKYNWMATDGVTAEVVISSASGCAQESSA